MGQKPRTSEYTKKTMESFTSQWSFFRGSDRTWNETVEQRKHVFLKEIDANADDLKAKVILDAGCGVGTAGEAMTELGLQVVGLDLSDGVYEAKKRIEYVVKGDLLNLPFQEGIFDIIYAKGTLHHTPDTYEAFKECTKKLKEGGLFYVWIYRKSVGFKRFLLRFVKPLFMHLPSKLKPYAYFPIAIIRMMREGLNFNEAMVVTFDFFSPPFRHEHAEEEVCGWFKECGFKEIRRTNNAKECFGLLGEKGN